MIFSYALRPTPYAGRFLKPAIFGKGWHQYRNSRYGTLGIRHPGLIVNPSHVFGLKYNTRRIKVMKKKGIVKAIGIVSYLSTNG